MGICQDAPQETNNFKCTGNLTLVARKLKKQKTCKLNDAFKTSGSHQAVRIVLVGDTAVGKSCLIHTYLRKAFNDGYEHTVLDIYKGITSYEQ